MPVSGETVLKCDGLMVTECDGPSEGDAICLSVRKELFLVGSQKEAEYNNLGEGREFLEDVKQRPRGVV